MKIRFIFGGRYGLMIYFMFGTEEAAEMLDVPNKHIIGINGTDMPFTTPDDTLISIGLCGGYKVPVGTIVEPSYCIDANTMEFVRIHPAFLKNTITHLCFTTDHFVTEPLTDGASIYDMELFKICGLPHKYVHSIKIVSDNLNEPGCEKYDNKEAWAKVQQIINEYLGREKCLRK